MKYEAKNPVGNLLLDMPLIDKDTFMKFENQILLKAKAKERIVANFECIYIFARRFIIDKMNIDQEQGPASNLE